MRFMAIVTKVNLTLNKYLWERFNELREEAYEITGERINFSSYTNAVLKQLVDTLEVFIQKKKEGTLTPDFMIEHFRKLAGAEEKKVIREAYKQRGKRKPAKTS
jgi:protein associated with RNAse G/E